MTVSQDNFTNLVLRSHSQNQLFLLGMVLKNCKRTSDISQTAYSLCKSFLCASKEIQNVCEKKQISVHRDMIRDQESLQILCSDYRKNTPNKSKERNVRWFLNMIHDGRIPQKYALEKTGLLELSAV